MVDDLNGSLVAERNVLGSVLLDDSCAAKVFSSLTEDAFAAVDKRNAYIFRAMNTLLEDHKKIDISTVHAQLATMQLDKECNSPEYLSELMDLVVNPNNVDYYIGDVRDFDTLRKFVKAMDSAKSDVYGGKVENIGDFLNTKATELTGIANRRSVGNFKESKDVVNQVLIDLDKARNTGNKRLIGIDTGYQKLNDLIHGFQPETLNIIAARPSVGKTAFAINLMVNAAKSLIGQNKTIAFFSCEMDASRIMQRLVSAGSLVPLERIQLGNITPGDNTKILTASQTLGQLPIYFDDTPNQYLGDIIAKCEKIATSTKGNLAAVFIDYLNIIRVPVSRATESRTLQIAMITSQLKELARRLHIPVILLAQLNRDADKGTYQAGKGQVASAPELSSLKESSAIEQDADVIMMLWRNDWAGKNNDNNQDSAPAEGQKETELQQLTRMVKESNAKNGGKNDASIIQVSIQKNRNGKTDKFYLLYEKSYQLISAVSTANEDSFQDLDD